MAAVDLTGDPGPVAIPIDGVLDLHTFSPREVKDLVPDYLAACLDKGIRHVRIIHGKGTGALRRTVHAILGRLPVVASFALADLDGGSWGATLVVLKDGPALAPG
ncbi:MAG: Smr/MutS family protein, partial [Candidatus Riflebacteria bacterium]|nr:Smr/MutS family protein [Candidatus Riflebacteria bacterium]